MWMEKDKPPVMEFLIYTFGISILCTICILLLEPYSILFSEKGTITAGYVIYAIIGIFFDTPGPMIATYLVLRRHKKIQGVKDFCIRFMHTENMIKTVLITGGFCASALCIAWINGVRTDAPWFLLILALPLTIIGGGVEEVGWRGFLQPAMERRFRFPLATILVSVIWYVWHLALWLEPTSNHYGDSLIGFGIMIFIWSFIGAAIYKATESVFACMMYHAFINAIGAIYDWNSLFDVFPGNIKINTYRVIMLIAAIVIWLASDRKRKSKNTPNDNEIK